MVTSDKEKMYGPSRRSVAWREELSELPGSVLPSLAKKRRQVQELHCTHRYSPSSLEDFKVERSAVLKGRSFIVKLKVQFSSN